MTKYQEALEHLYRDDCATVRPDPHCQNCKEIKNGNECKMYRYYITLRKAIEEAALFERLLSHLYITPGCIELRLFSPEMRKIHPEIKYHNGLSIVNDELMQDLNDFQSDYFKVGGRYIYSFDNSSGHTEALIEIVKKHNDYAIIKFIEIYEEHTGNDYFAYLLKTNDTMGASYKYLHEVKK